MGSTRHVLEMEHSPISKPEEGIFVLPGGYVDDAGTVHREVQLNALCGRDEEYLASIPANTPSANVITQLLARCLRQVGNLPHVDASVIRRMLVGDREYLILKLRQISHGDKLHTIFPCQFAECGKDMEVSLSLKDIPVEERPVTGRGFTLQVDGASLEFRLPNGEDQEELAPYVDHPACVRELLARCVLRMPDSIYLDEVGSLIEERMEQIAPQVELELDAVCPECGRSFSAMIDLPALVLEEFAVERPRLRQEVHFLAWHYHWSESEILAMPRHKRRSYIELLQTELERTTSS
jgi:hypothetical protein